MTKAPNRFLLNFDENLAINSYGRRMIQAHWARLQSYFNIEVVTNGSEATVINYRYEPNSSNPTGGNGTVHLRGRSSLTDEIVMHETFHALNIYGHSQLSHRLTTRTETTNRGPGIRIQDFIYFLNKYGARDWTDEQSIFSWQYQAGSKTYAAYRQKLTDGVASTPEFLRTLSERYLYDLVYRTTGYNILDFRNYTTQLRVDLRPSEFLSGRSTININRLFGTRTDFKNNWFGLNIINVPGVKLDEAWAGAGHDLVIGNGGANKLLGNAGWDTLRGLGGDDTLDGGADINTVDYSMDAGEGGNSGILVNMTQTNIELSGKWVNAGTALDGFGSVDTLISIQNIIGTSFADYIVGSDANNVLVGRAGDDTLDGSEGIDTVDYSGDRIAGGTAPVVVSLLNKTASDGFGNQDVLVSIENVIGTGFGDSITGNNGINVLEGRSGDDTLDGAGGNDSMIGGAGHDFFIYGMNYGADVIRDFAVKGRRSLFDKLLISKSLVSDYDTLMSHASQAGTSIRFDFGQGNTLTLENMNMDLTKFRRYLDQVEFV